MFLSFSFRKCPTVTALLKLDVFQKSCQRPWQTSIQSQWNNCKVIVPKSSLSGCLNKSALDNMKICLVGSLRRKGHDYICCKMSNYTETSESRWKSSEVNIRRLICLFFPFSLPFLSFFFRSFVRSFLPSTLEHVSKKYVLQLTLIILSVCIYFIPFPIEVHVSP